MKDLVLCFFLGPALEEMTTSLQALQARQLGRYSDPNALFHFMKFYQELYRESEVKLNMEIDFTDDIHLAWSSSQQLQLPRTTELLRKVAACP